MKKSLWGVLIVLSVMQVAWGGSAYLSPDGTCPSGWWLNERLCKLCADWGAGYTSDGGSGDISSCYDTCDDGRRVYWPYTCTDGVCAAGAYLSGAECLVCPDKYYCPGDNTQIDCRTTIRAQDPVPDAIYSLIDGWHYGHSHAYQPGNCYCEWNLRCDDGSCKTYIAYRPCIDGPGDDMRLTPEKCSDGYYATNYIIGAGAYERCVPCTGLPENATFTSYGTPDGNYENGDNCPWRCNDGWGRAADGTCGALCSAGVTYLRTSTGVSVPLFSVRNTSPSINIEVDNNRCYIDLVPGGATNAINVRFNGQTYHTVN